MLHSNSIGKKVAEARKKINLSQAELAQQISISPQAVGKWERGESMPDISTLNRLAAIFGVDLNYFSDSYQSNEFEKPTYEKYKAQAEEDSIPKQRKSFDWNWDMSRENWADADFSGLTNLKEKFNSASLKNCKFMDSELSGITFRSNEILTCDFSGSDMRNAAFHNSEIIKDTFINCSFIDAEFTKSEIKNCNFSNSNFSGASFSLTNFQNNITELAVWDHTSFKDTQIAEIVFEGNMENCSFEGCTFKRVRFQNAIIKNTFFKYNSKLNRVEFINCKVDNISYAFLKNGKADMAEIALINEQ